MESVKHKNVLEYYENSNYICANDICSYNDKLICIDAGGCLYSYDCDKQIVELKNNLNNEESDTYKCRSLLRDKDICLCIPANSNRIYIIDLIEFSIVREILLEKDYLFALPAFVFDGDAYILFASLDYTLFRISLESLVIEEIDDFKNKVNQFVQDINGYMALDLIHDNGSIIFGVYKSNKIIVYDLKDKICKIAYEIDKKYRIKAAYSEVDSAYIICSLCCNKLVVITKKTKKIRVVDIDFEPYMIIVKMNEAYIVPDKLNKIKHLDLKSLEYLNDYSFIELKEKGEIINNCYIKNGNITVLTNRGIYIINTEEDLQYLLKKSNNVIDSMVKELNISKQKIFNENKVPLEAYMKYICR